MLHKLAEVEARYEELNRLLSDPEVLSDQNRLREVAKEHREVEELVGVDRTVGRRRAATGLVPE